jgi:hypothetical protein
MLGSNFSCGQMLKKAALHAGDKTYVLRQSSIHDSSYVVFNERDSYISWIPVSIEGQAYDHTQPLITNSERG